MNANNINDVIGCDAKVTEHAQQQPLNAKFTHIQMSIASSGFVSVRVHFCARACIHTVLSATIHNPGYWDLTFPRGGITMGTAGSQELG